MELVANSVVQLNEIAQKAIKYAGEEKIWLFYGEMGAGKTTFIKEICKILGIQDVVNSPTFSIVNEYKHENGDTFYHLDLYRINHESEAMDIGIEDYFYSGNYCFIEWPSKIQSLIPDTYLSIEIHAEAGGERKFNFVKYE